MGIGFSHGGASWAYSGFMRFREKIAEHEGIDLPSMWGFKSQWDMRENRRLCAEEGLTWLDAYQRVENGGVWVKGGPNQWPGLSWSEVDSPLKPLLDHSDCDGWLEPWECMAMVEPLVVAVTETWPLTALVDHNHDRYLHDRHNGLLLARGMKTAGVLGERLEFS